MKLQIKISKILCFVALGVCALNFIFALGLTTDIYNLFSLDVKGREIFFDIQPFNKNLVVFIIATILSVVLMLITKTHSRRKYYISNYVAIIVTAILFLAVAIYSIINIVEFKSYFLNNTDFVTWEEMSKMFVSVKYTGKSTFWFDINIFTAVLYILTAILLVGNLIWKIMLMRFEDKLLNSSESLEIGGKNE